MKKVFAMALVGGTLALASCGGGPSAEEKAAMEQARLDSIKAAEQAKLDAEAAAAAAAAEAAAAEAEAQAATEEVKEDNPQKERGSAVEKGDAESQKVRGGAVEKGNAESQKKRGGS